MYENSQQSSPGSRRAAWIGLFVGPLLLLACLVWSTASFNILCFGCS